MLQCCLVRIISKTALDLHKIVFTELIYRKMAKLLKTKSLNFFFFFVVLKIKSVNVHISLYSLDIIVFDFSNFREI